MISERFLVERIFAFPCVLGRDNDCTASTVYCEEDYLRSQRKELLSVDGLKRGQIGATFVDRHRLGFTILSDRFFELESRS